MCSVLQPAQGKLFEQLYVTFLAILKNLVYTHISCFCAIIIKDLPTFVGMQMYKPPSNTSVVCACLYSGGLPSPIPVYNPAGVNIMNAGYGPIFQTNSTKTGFSFTCYMYNNVGALPTYAPTKAPVTPSPTKKAPMLLPRHLLPKLLLMPCPITLNWLLENVLMAKATSFLRLV
jgi:hypothetical protein